MAAIFLYVGVEVSTGTFLTNYIADALKIGVRPANSYVAFYWGGMLAGQLAGSFLLKRLKPSLVLSVCAATAILLILISVNSEGYIAVWAMLACGLCNSVMFAIIFSLAVNGLGVYTTQASGILSTAIVGGAVISLLMSLVKDRYNWPMAFMVPLACYVYLLFYGINGHKTIMTPPDPIRSLALHNKSIGIKLLLL